MTANPADDHTSSDDPIEARFNRLEAQLEDLAAEALGSPTPAPPATAGRPGEPFYPDLETWVIERFAPMYGRAVGVEMRWCARWWEHAEAISRLEALWRAWEVLRLDPGLGMATWYVQYLDPQLAVLCSNRGPFSRCKPDQHEPVRGLPVERAPEGTWDL